MRWTRSSASTTARSASGRRRCTPSPTSTGRTSSGLIDEELALLRGRDETLGGVAAGPTYNRLTWNFTNGEGEVAYVMNYNIKDVNLDGFINEADAAIMYPQGHGDAYGQLADRGDACTTSFCSTRTTPGFRARSRCSVAGAPVVVDYYDERRFAAAAAGRARMGAEVVDLTYRKNYAEPDVQPYTDTYVDKSDRCDTTRGARLQRAGVGRGGLGGRARRGRVLRLAGGERHPAAGRTTATPTCGRSTGRRWRISPPSPTSSAPSRCNSTGRTTA